MDRPLSGLSAVRLRGPRAARAPNRAARPGAPAASPGERMSAPRIDAAERRARLGRRHLLLPSTRVDDPVEVVRSLLAVHATDPATVFLEFWARMVPGTAEVKAIEDALYEDRSIVRMLGMRRTLFVVPT